jgi:DNA (cytosine-5)-methyltransferase 1
MLMDTSLWGSIVCFLTWKERVTPGKRLLFQLVPSMRNTEEIDVSLLPTPTATSYGTNQGGAMGRTGKVRPSLQTMARHNLWPTPDASQRGARSTDLVVNESTVKRRNSGQKRGMDLQTAVKLWPTPTTQEIEHPKAELTQSGRRLSKEGKSSHSLNLADSVKIWPTPTVKGNYNKEGLSKKSGDGLATAVKKESVSGSLNPEWVEWLMGFPTGWTDLKD